MNKHLPDFRKIVQPRLHIDFTSGGAFTDKLDQVRDGVQTTCSSSGIDNAGPGPHRFH